MIEIDTAHGQMFGKQGITSFRLILGGFSNTIEKNVMALWIG